MRQKQKNSVKPIPADKRLPTNQTRWTEEELKKLVQGFKKYGKDYKKLAEFIGNKTPRSVALKF